jgi:hypothetical protein
VPISTTLGGFDAAGFLDSLPMPTLQMDLFPDMFDNNPPSRNQDQDQNQAFRNQGTTRTPAQAGRNNPNIRTPQNTRGTTTRETMPPSSLNNPFLDDDEPAAPPQDNRQRLPNMPATVPRDTRDNTESIHLDALFPESDEVDESPLFEYDGLPSWNPLE